MILRKDVSNSRYKTAQENVIDIKKNIVTPPSSVGGEGEFPDMRTLSENLRSDV